MGGRAVLGRFPRRTFLHEKSKSIEFGYDAV